MEQWKKIENHPKYSVSNQGNVRNDKSGRILSKRVDKKGYCRANLDGKDYKVHRLVAENFNPNPLGYPQINHKDTNKQNNNDWNLEWCDNSMNQLHAYQTGLQGSREGELNGHCRLSDKEVLEIWDLGLTVKDIIVKYGLSEGYSRQIVKRQVRKYLLG